MLRVSTDDRAELPNAKSESWKLNESIEREGGMGLTLYRGRLTEVEKTETISRTDPGLAEASKGCWHSIHGLSPLDLGLGNMRLTTNRS